MNRFVRFFWNQLGLSFGVNTEINILKSMFGYKDIQVDKLENVFLKSCSWEKQATADLAFFKLEKRRVSHIALC